MNKLWVKKNSDVHGSGLFASQNIKKGSKIIKYVGDKVTKKEGDRRADIQLNKAKRNKNNGMVYVFELNKRYDIDGDARYNHARLINHSCNPNCEVDIKNNQIWISSIKRIKKGEEFTYDYGYSFDKDDLRDNLCKCGSKNCIGFIISSDDWDKYLKYLKRFIKKKN